VCRLISGGIVLIKLFDGPRPWARPDAYTADCATSEEVTVLPPVAAHRFTVIVPTRNGEGGIAPLLDGLIARRRDTVAKVLSIDDGVEDGPEASTIVVSTSGRAARLLQRTWVEQKGGSVGALRPDPQHVRRAADLRAAAAARAARIDGT
jgi:hypothetical protein